MADLKVVARLARWAASSMASNLAHLPEDKLDWKPTEASKSALEVVGEVVQVMKMTLPAFDGGELDFQLPRATPSNLAEAQQWLLETSEQYAARLEAAGPELERTLESPFGPFWGPVSVTFGLVDMLHHHGQITYLQSLLGDAENHMDPEALMQCFGAPQG